MPPRSWSSLGGDHGRLVGLVFAGAVFVVGKEGGQRAFVTAAVGVRGVGAGRF